MKILYLTQYFPPEFGAAAARAHGMTRWLARFGHEVTVITAIPHYLLDAIPDKYRGKRWVREELDGVEVYRAWVYASHRRHNLTRMANYVSFMLSSWWYARRLPGPFDVIIASSPPLFLGLTGVRLSRRFQIPLVFDVRDLWPEVGVRLGAFRPGSLMLRLWNEMADFVYRHATAIIPVTQGMYEDMLRRGLPKEKLHLIPNGIDLASVKEEVPDLREELSLEKRFVVLYAGLLGVMHGPEIIAEAAHLLRDQPDIHFLIVGDGVKRAAIAEKIHNLKLHTVTLLPMQPANRIPRFLKTADVCLATLSGDFVTGVRPYKMLEAWAYRRPVIVTDADEAAALVQACRAGLTTPPGDAKALADAILELKEHPNLARQMGSNGRRCIEERWNREKLARDMEYILIALTE